MLDKILVAVDGSKHSDAAFALALDMVKKYGSQLFVINVYQGGGGAGTMVSPGYEEDQRSIAQEILDSYEAKANEAGLPNVRMVLQKGDAAQVIIETGNDEKCQLIILGSRGRGAFKELLLGSVSHKVANHAGCAVLIVR
jgi:nucleotide-binding universal stress UspA family protein